MTAEVSLQDIVAAMDLPNAEWASYLDPETGEIVTAMDEDRRLLEADGDPAVPNRKKVPDTLRRLTR